MLSTEETTELKELKDTGFIYLKKDQKERYRELSAKSKDTAPTKAQEETVSVPKSQLDEMLKRLENLEGGGKRVQAGLNTWREKKDRVRERTITLKLFTPEGEAEMYPVVAHAKKPIYRKVGGELTPFIKITYLKEDDTEVEAEVTLLEYAKVTDRVTADVKKEHVKKLEQRVGKTINRQKYNYDNYNSTPAPAVDQYVTAETRTFDIKLPDGRELNVDENVINGS